MARLCTICIHPKRREIDAAIVAHDSRAVIARRFHVVENAVRNHKEQHLSSALRAAINGRELQHSDNLISRLRELVAEAHAALVAAKDGDDWELVLKAVQRMEKQIELEARLLGTIDGGGAGAATTTVNVLVASSEWAQLRAVILAALEPYPDALRALSNSLATMREVTG